MTLRIIDTALYAAPNATRASAAADLIVIPCRPTALNLAVVGSAVEIVTAAKKPRVFILSGCPPRAPEIEETRTVLAEYGLPVLPVSITDHRAFARAVASPAVRQSPNLTAMAKPLMKSAVVALAKGTTDMSKSAAKSKPTELACRLYPKAISRGFSKALHSGGTCCA
jgi:hypothetical protein